MRTAVPRTTRPESQSRVPPPRRPRRAVEHRPAGRRNPDASRSCSARGIGVSARHARSVPHGSTDSVRQPRAGRRAAHRPSSPIRNRSVPDRSVRTPPPARGNARTETSGLSGASALRQQCQSAMDAKPHECHTAVRTRASALSVGGVGSNVPVRTDAAFVFASVGPLSGQCAQRCSQPIPSVRGLCAQRTTPEQNHHPARPKPRANYA